MLTLHHCSASQTYTNQCFTTQPVLLTAPTPLKRKENKGKYQMVNVIQPDNLYFRKEAYGEQT